MLGSFSQGLVAVFLLVGLTGVTPANAQLLEAPPPYASVCSHTHLFSTSARVAANFSSGWKRRFPLLILNLQTKALYWAPNYLAGLEQLNYQGFAPHISTTDNVLVLVCNAQQGDNSSASFSYVQVNGSDALAAAAAAANYEPPAGALLDRLYILDAAKGNDITRVDFIGTSNKDTIATVLIERHRVIHFSAGGGVLLSEGTSSNISLLTVPTTTITTSTVNATVASGSTTTSSTTSTTPATTTGSASFAYVVRNTRPQVNGIVGLTWYLFGHDTFPVSKARGNAVTYSSYSAKQSLGLFLGTSVSSLGNFTVGPALEVRPGIQLFAGTTWYSKSFLPTNVSACSGYGTSAAYQPYSPTTSSSAVVSAGPPQTTTTTTTTVTASTTNGCINGNVATPLGGSNLPTSSKYEPSFSFGLLFNTNLFKAFSGIK